MKSSPLDKSFDWTILSAFRTTVKSCLDRDALTPLCDWFRITTPPNAAATSCAMAPPPAQAFEKSVFGASPPSKVRSGWLILPSTLIRSTRERFPRRSSFVRKDLMRFLGVTLRCLCPIWCTRRKAWCNRQSRPLEDAKTDLLWLKKHAKAQAPKAASKKAEQPPKVGASTTVGPSTSPGEKAKLKTEQAPLRTAKPLTPVAPPSRGCATVEHGSGLSGLLLACGIMGLRRRRRR